MSRATRHSGAVAVVPEEQELEKRNPTPVVKSEAPAKKKAKSEKRVDHSNTFADFLAGKSTAQVLKLMVGKVVMFPDGDRGKVICAEHDDPAGRNKNGYKMQIRMEPKEGEVNTAEARWTCYSGKTLLDLELV